MRAQIENLQPIVKTTGTHPMLTVSFYGAIIVAIVVSGSYFSKQRLIEREMAAAELAAHGNILSVTNR